MTLAIKSPGRSFTGVAGFDEIANGGLLSGRSALIAGTAGSGKTIFALQFLAIGARQYGEKGVLVTFEEEPADIVGNVRSLEWTVEDLVEAGHITVVDCTSDTDDSFVETGAFDLSGLLVRIEAAVRGIGAKRLVLDSVGSLLARFADAAIVRREMRRLMQALRRLDVTALITLERTEEDGPVGRFGVEEFVADTVMILRNRLDREKRRRTIEIQKFRGSSHHKGEYPFTIDPRSGLIINPLSGTALQSASGNERVSWGPPELDQMCGGGIYRDSVILVSGATGAGKTLLMSEFVRSAIKANERVLLFGSEESRDQLTRNAAGWGLDLEAGERAGLLRIICRFPELMSLEDHLVQIKRELAEFAPKRMAVDSMSAFERVASEQSFREFVINLTSYVKENRITGLMTNNTSVLLGGESVTETHISSITDMIVLLRYVEVRGAVRRGMAILKMRGSRHDHAIREYMVSSDGLRIGAPFHGVQGILAGAPTYSYAEEVGHLQEMLGGTSGQ